MRYCPMFLFEKGIGVFIVEDNRLYLPKQMDLASFVIKSVSELNQDGQQEEYNGSLVKTTLEEIIVNTF